MIKDSGERKEFETGAVRDIKEGRFPNKIVKMEAIAWSSLPKLYLEDRNE